MLVLCSDCGSIPKDRGCSWVHQGKVNTSIQGESALVVPEGTDVSGTASPSDHGRHNCVYIYYAED
jgi:hypothetical protein